MSITFDKANDSGSGDWIKADDDDTKLVPSFPFSVSLWVRLDANVSGTETIWFYGDKDHTVRYFVLEARLVSGSTKLLARLVNETGPTPIASYSAVVSIGDWHLVTVVASEENDEVTLDLYLDDETVLSSSPTSVNSNLGDYNRFALGRWAGSTGSTKPCSFMAEQAAIWNSELTSGNHNTLRADPEGEEFLRRPPSHLSPEPNIGYWVLAGHHRHGLLASNDPTQAVVARGDFFNEAGGSQPDMELGNTSVEPRWSCQTPAVLYLDPDPVAESELPTRQRKVSPSRYNPQFFVFSQPELIEPWINDPGNAPMWDDPHFVMMARVRLDSANGDTYVPPVFIGKDPYLYRGYLTQITRRIADWFEYQRFEKGRGSEGGGNYEGTLYLQDLGWQLHDNGERGLEPTAGKGFGIPLEQNHQDKALNGDKTWACWFRKNGERLTKEYGDTFWPLLKAELDRRGLCYPKRLHWDLESSPEPPQVVSGGGTAPNGDSNFPHQLTDSRATDAAHALVDGLTLSDIWDTEVPVDYTKKADPLAGDNPEWRTWFQSWQHVIRDEAVYKSVIATALTTFPETKWSNYEGLIADNPDYKYLRYWPDEERNTPSEITSIDADYYSPVLYSALRIQKLIDAGFGVTKQSAQLKVFRQQIDACANTSVKKPIAPWVGFVGYRDTEKGYRLTREDLRHILRYAWQRGVDEFIMFPSTTDYETDNNATYEECKFLVNTVTCMMNTHGSRTSRMGRTYRHCR